MRVDHSGEQSERSAWDPRGEYERRLGEGRELARRLSRQDDRLGNARLGVFLVSLVLGALAWHGDLGWAWAAASLLGFVLLVVLHGRVAIDRRRAEGRVALLERGIARLDGRWA